MIWALVREQVRSQRRYTVATAVLVAVTVALVTYGGFLAVTLMHSSGAVDTFYGSDRDSTAYETFGDGAEFTSVVSDIDAANTEGHQVVANGQVHAVLSVNSAGQIDNLDAVYGDTQWSTVLVEGSPPSAGEIAVNAQWASERGVEIGDRVELQAMSQVDMGTATPIGVTLTVSGLTRSWFAEAGISMDMAGGFVAWSDVPAVNEAAMATINAGMPAGSEPYPADYSAFISGNGDWQWSQDLVDQSSIDDTSRVPSSVLVVGILTGIGVAALIIGLIATAFGLGRAQGQARAQWVGTARALGATKRHVAVATLLECAVVGVGAGLAGVALGGAATLAHLWLVATRVASPMLLRAPAGYVAVAAAGVLLALVLALIVGAVPAFWASRIEPAAALKPSQDVTSIEVSRRVWVWPVAVLWAASLVVVIAMTTTAVEGVAGLPIILAIAALLTTSVALGNEVLRRSLPWHARRLSRSRRRAILVAGDAILARPRQSTVPAFIVALATTVVVALFAQLVASWAMYDPTDGGSDIPNPYISPLVFLGVSIVVTLLCVVVGVATATVTAREAATREALGLTRAEGRAAVSVQYLVAQAHGLALGLVGGAIGGVIALRAGIDDPFLSFGTWAGPVAYMVLVIVGIAAACAVVGAGIVAALAPTTAPLSRVEVSA